MKLEILAVKEEEKQTADFFSGSYTSKGVSIKFMPLESGMFYIGNQGGCLIAGREETWFIPNVTEGEAIFAFQNNAETVNCQKIVVNRSWLATTNFGRGATEEFSSQEEAMEFAFNCTSCVKEVAEYSAPVFVDEILNLTQHSATTEQVESGVVEPEHKAAIQAAITFDVIPTGEEIRQRANLVAQLAADSGCKKAMIGGAPFFMSALESALKNAGLQPLYSFSVRESADKKLPDGSIQKIAVFKHSGFVEA